MSPEGRTCWKIGCGCERDDSRMTLGLGNARVGGQEAERRAGVGRGSGHTKVLASNGHVSGEAKGQRNLGFWGEAQAGIRHLGIHQHLEAARGEESTKGPINRREEIEDAGEARCKPHSSSWRQALRKSHVETSWIHQECTAQ